MLVFTRLFSKLILISICTSTLTASEQNSKKEIYLLFKDTTPILRGELEIEYPLYSYLLLGRLITRQQVEDKKPSEIIYEGIFSTADKEKLCPLHIKTLRGNSKKSGIWLMDSKGEMKKAQKINFVPYQDDFFALEPLADTAPFDSWENLNLNLKNVFESTEESELKSDENIKNLRKQSTSSSLTEAGSEFEEF